MLKQGTTGGKAIAKDNTQHHFEKIVSRMFRIEITKEYTPTANLHTEIKLNLEVKNSKDFFSKSWVNVRADKHADS